MKKFFAGLAIVGALVGCAENPTTGELEFSWDQVKSDAVAAAQYWQDYSNGAVAQIAEQGIAAVCPECIGPINLAILALNAASADILAGKPGAQNEAYQASQDLNKAVGKAQGAK